MEYFDYNGQARTDLRKIAHVLNDFFDKDIEGLSGSEQKTLKTHVNKLLKIASRI